MYFYGKIPLMFEDYKKEVIEFYRLKKASGELSTALESPERLKLRKECLLVYARKNSKEDGEIIRGFFDPSGKYNDHVKSIECLDLDKFRPLVNYLTKGTTIRDEHAVKLLAWLLDFKSYGEWRASKYVAPALTNSEELATGEIIIEDDWKNTYTKERKGNDIGTIPQQQNENDSEIIRDPPLEEENTLISVEGNRPLASNAENENNRQIHPASGDRRKSIWRYIPIAIGLIVLVGTVGIVLQIVLPSATNVPSPEEKCMYWDGNQYVPVECGKKAVNPTTIPLDINVLKGFRRISWPDTLSKNSIGEVWYAKRAGKYEFFTDSAMHPVDTQRSLKPLTQYILSNHLSYHRFILEVLVVALSLILLLLALFFIARKVLGSRRILLNLKSDHGGEHYYTTVTSNVKSSRSSI